MTRSLVAAFWLFSLAGVGVGATLDLGSASATTPYDRYFSPVKTVLANLNGAHADLNRVSELMREGRGFAYVYTDPYVASAPEVTSVRHSGDCKDKALWLASQLNDPSVRFVIGKAKISSKISHAWLLWEDRSRWFVLDCTNSAAPIALEKISTKQYIPFYSFSPKGAFRHMASPRPSLERVAGKSKATDKRS
jgi:hypothetical protein